MIYRISSIKPLGGLLILSHQKGGLLEGGGLIGGGAYLIFQVKVRKNPKILNIYVSKIL